MLHIAYNELFLPCQNMPINLRQLPSNNLGLFVKKIKTYVQQSIVGLEQSEAAPFSKRTSVQPYRDTEKFLF